MPSPVFDLAIMAPDHRLFEGRVRSLVAPGVSGYFGVLARHAPMVAELAPGVLSVTAENAEKTYFAVSSGFLEVTLEGVAVMADAAEAAADIDVRRAQAAEERARLRLRAPVKNTDLARAEAALQRALARLNAVQMSSTRR